MKSVPLPGEVIRRLPSRRITDDEFSFHRETDVILRESLGCGSRTGHVIQFGKLAAMVEGILIWKAMQHGSHPPREPLHFPDAPQAHFRIGVEQVATSSVTRMLESPRAAGDACRKSQIDRDKTNWCGPQSWVRATEPDGSREGLLQFAHSAWTDALGRRVVQQDLGRWLLVHFLSINPRNSVIRGGSGGSRRLHG